jgi:hypothetical protein
MSPASASNVAAGPAIVVEIQIDRVHLVGILAPVSLK